MEMNIVKRLIDDLIEVVGISEELPINAKCFKQFQVQEICCIPKEKPDIEKILRLIVSVEVLFTKIIKTPIGVSYEGQKLTGKKLLVRGKLVQKLEYIAVGDKQAVHSAEFETPFSTYIVLDECVENIASFQVIPYIEDIYIKQIDKRCVFKNITILLNLFSNQCVMNKLCKLDEKEDCLANRYKNYKFHKCNKRSKKYFNQFVVKEFVEVPSIKPDIEQVLSVIVEPEIISQKVINTAKGISREGQQLSGKKIVVELKIKQKILYVADFKEQSVHGFENEFYQSTYVVVPQFIQGTEVEVLLKNNLLQPELKVEDVYFKQIDKRRIFKNITILLQYNFIPTYQICYCHNNNCTSSELFLIYEDGKNPCQITFEEGKKYKNPKWSPNGQNIAYLSYENPKEKCMLNYINVKNLKQIQLTYPYMFDSITSFTWSKDSNKIIFTGIKNNSKDIFEINIGNLEIKQLTNGNGIVKNYKPKCSKDGSKIAYIRSINNITNIYVMDSNGYNNAQITRSGHIRDFDWLDDKIVYFWDNPTAQCSLCIVDINTFITKELNIPNELIIKKCLRVSPDNRFIAFVGAKYENIKLNDIYVYEIKTGCLINITNNSYEFDIRDLDWKADSSQIYYASNEELFYNIYSISLLDFCKTQITNTDSSNIELCYRPKIR